MNDEMDFVECSRCAAKSGSPALCLPCLRNRALIAALKQARKEGKKRMAKLLKNIDDVQDRVRQEFYHLAPDLDETRRLARDAGTLFGEVYVTDGEIQETPLQSPPPPLTGFAGELVRIVEPGMAEIRAAQAEPIRILKIAAAALMDAHGLKFEIVPERGCPGIRFILRMADFKKEIYKGSFMSFCGHEMIRIEPSATGYPVRFLDMQADGWRTVDCMNGDELERAIIEVVRDDSFRQILDHMIPYGRKGKVDEQ